MSSHFQDALQLSEDIRLQKKTCVTVITGVFETIERLDPSLQVTLYKMKEEAIQTAMQLDRLVQSGQNLGPLAGVPILIKDNICMDGTPTTCASKLLERFVAPYDATVIQHLKSAGMIPVAKVNMDEFAMGSSTENSAFFPTKNPWDLSRVPGGSSGGSAAGVAAGFASLALGSDTGGSIRQPASFCGVLGLKPTYGRVSRYGLVAYASSLDQIGVFSHTAREAAALLDVISGYDNRDSTSANIEHPSFFKALTGSMTGIRIGVPQALMGPTMSEEVVGAVQKALDVWTSLGGVCEPIPLSLFESALATYYILAPAEASANLARFDGVRYGLRADKTMSLIDMMAQSRGKGFGKEVQRRILIGTYVLSSGYYDAYYSRAKKSRAFVIQEFSKAFRDYDVIVTPTTPSTAFKLGEHAENPLAMYLADIATIPVNLAGLPAMSIPCGFDKQGLPIGVQLIGKKWDEATLLNLAAAYQSVTDFHLKMPHVGGVYA